MKALKWILSTWQLTYKDRLPSLDILPLSLYHELHVLLLLDIVSGWYSIEWRNFIQVSEQHDQNTRTGDTRRFKTRNLSRQKQESNLWTRGAYIGRKVGQSVDSIPAASKKKKITEVYTNFTEIYYHENVCTCRLSCLCALCRNLIKLE